MTAFRPDPQTLLMVNAETVSGRPPLSAAWRAGFWPLPAWMTLPMMHSSTIAGSIPARRTASRTTIAPSCGAVNSLREPRNLPVGVRTAETITASRMDGQPFHHVIPQEQLDARQDRAARAIEFARPVRAIRSDVKHAVPQLDRRRPGQCRADCGRPREADFAGGERL